jgi:hypothetical protein
LESLASTRFNKPIGCGSLLQLRRHSSNGQGNLARLGSFSEMGDGMLHQDRTAHWVADRWHPSLVPDHAILMQFLEHWSAHHAVCHFSLGPAS